MQGAAGCMKLGDFVSPRMWAGARRIFSRPLAGLMLVAKRLPNDARAVIPFKSGDLEVQPWKGWRTLLRACMFRDGWSCALRDGEVVVTIKGHDILVRPNDSDRYSFNGLQVSDYYGVGQLDLHGQLIIDIGANAGYSAIQAAMSGADVVTFEALPETAEFCARNIAGSGLSSKIDLRAAAVVGGNTTHIDFYHAPGSSWSASPFEDWVKRVEDGSAVHVRVPAVNINSVLAEFKERGVAWLKFNVEGSEWDILENASDESLKIVKRITTEMHDTGGDKLVGRARRLIARLEELGFHVSQEPDLGALADDATFPEHVSIDAIRSA